MKMIIGRVARRAAVVGLLLLVLLGLGTVSAKADCSDYDGSAAGALIGIGGTSGCAELGQNAPDRKVAIFDELITSYVTDEPKKQPKNRVWEQSGCTDVFDNLDPSCIESAPDCRPGESLVQAWSMANKPGRDLRTASKVGGLRCVGPEDPQLPEVVAERPSLSLEEFLNLGIISAEAQVQPRPHTLIRAHTNFYAEAETQEFNITLAGEPVRVRATPASYLWDYGDGTTLGPTTDAGGPLRDSQLFGDETSTSHAYQDTLDYTVLLTTYFNGEFSVNGGPWEAVRGQAVVPSAPVVMSVWRSDTRSVAENCLENPAGWGC